MSVNAEEIDLLLGQIARRKANVGFLESHPRGEFLPRVERPYYAPFLNVPESVHPGQVRRHRGIGSWASSATFSSRSSNFDAVDAASTVTRSTASTVPRSHVFPQGPPAVSQQRPLIPDFTQSWLPCEFRRYGKCSAAFRFADVNSWIDHILSGHLHYRLPTVTACWFCDAAIFRSASTREDDKMSSYRQRMLHIADHFFQGMSAAEVRPDYNMVKHMRQSGLMDESTFRRATKRDELPARFLVHEFRDDEPTSRAHEESREHRSHSRRKHSSSQHRSGRHLDR